MRHDATSHVAFRLANVNLEYGGQDADGSTHRLEALTALREISPHAVLVQELAASRPGLNLWRHVRRISNELGMDVVMGPVLPDARNSQHISILVNTADAWTITDQSPYAEAASGSRTQESCSVELHHPHLARSLSLFCVHLHARSAAMRLLQAETIAAFATAKDDQHVIIGGDFNGYGRGGPHVTSDDRTKIPRHLRVSRCVVDDDGKLLPDFGVDDVFVRKAGLTDLAAHLPEQRREPSELTPTGKGGARRDRFYGPQAVATAAKLYRQFPIGSDHAGLFIDLNFPRS